MKLHLPKAFMMAILGSVIAGNLRAEAVIPGAVVTTTEEFMADDADCIAKDGSGTVEITGEVTKNASLYVREGKVVVGSTETDTTLVLHPNTTKDNTAFSVSGKNAVLEFVNAIYRESDSSMKHVGGADGNGTLIFSEGSVIEGNNSELFTVGVQGGYGPSATEGFTGETSPAKNGSANTFGRGDVIVSGGSTFNASYRHVLMGEASFTVTGKDSVAVFGNKDSGSEYYKGFKTSLGVGENTTSEINVTNGGKLDIYASEMDKYLGGFSTNEDSNTTSVITVDGGTFSVMDPTNADPEKYPEGRAGTAYIGFGYMSEVDSYPQNTKTQIDVKGGGTANFNNHTTHLGYEGMKNNGSSVDITVHDASSELVFDGAQLYMHDGVTLNNHGKVTIDTTYDNNRLTDGSMFTRTDDAHIYGGIINNHKGAEINVVNGIEFGPGYSEAIENLVVQNDGKISAAEITVSGSTQVTNTGTMSADEITVSGSSKVENTGTMRADDLYVSGSEQFVNEGTVEAYLHLTATGGMRNEGRIEGTTWLNSADTTLTAVDGSSMQTVFLTAGSLNVEGIVDMFGNLQDYYSSADIVFTMDGSLDMNGNAITLNGSSIVLLVDCDITDGDTTTDFNFLNKSDLFTNYTSDTFSGDTEIVLRDAEGHEAVRAYKTLPEPTTATLSLLAMAALAVRRRRK